YGTPAVSPWTEDLAGNAESAYGAAKWRAEQALRAAPLPGFALRLPGLFGGERRNGLVFNLVAALRDGRVPVLPAQPVTWAAIDVVDAARAVATLALDAAAFARPADRK